MIFMGKTRGGTILAIHERVVQSVIRSFHNVPCSGFWKFAFQPLSWTLAKYDRLDKHSQDDEEYRADYHEKKKSIVDNEICLLVSNGSEVQIDRFAILDLK